MRLDCTLLSAVFGACMEDLLPDRVHTTSLPHKNAPTDYGTPAR